MIDAILIGIMSLLVFAIMLEVLLSGANEDKPNKVGDDFQSRNGRVE